VFERMEGENGVLNIKYRQGWRQYI
jgi:hypothetical protein